MSAHAPLVGKPIRTKRPSPVPTGDGGTRRTLARPRPAGLLAGLALLICLGGGVWSFVDLRINVSTIIDSAHNAADFTRRMFPLDFPPAGELFHLIWLTLAIVVSATLVSVVISIPLALLAARNTTPFKGVRPVVRALIVLARAISDVIFAIFFFRVFGLGGMTGVLGRRRVGRNPAGSGSIWFRTAGGERVDIATLPDSDIADPRGKEIGYVSQFLRPQPRRSVLDIVTASGIARGMHRADAKEAAAQALRQVDIAERLWDMHATVLSGGQKQRVNIAAGTISPPRLLLLDEPVSALDPANRAAVLETIARLEETGTVVLSVFHDLDAIERLATRVVVLGSGRVLASGSPETILHDVNLPLEVAR
jgi:alpha-D-ribose 1-methylphosphonate 5-triphosphate synthase subunit PhnL